jgi:hypothetical protein
MLIDDIEDLYLGCVSENIKQQAVAPEFDPLCFTFVSGTRTLDIRANDRQMRSRWVTFISKRIIQKRDQKRRIEQFKYNSTCSKPRLEEIWLADVIPNWDKHWNYRPESRARERAADPGLCLGCLPFFCFGRKIRLDEETEIPQVEERLTFPIKTQLLNRLWRMGLPDKARRVLWGLAMGNKIEMTKELYQMYKKQAARKKKLYKAMDREQHPIEGLVENEGVEAELQEPLVMMLKVFGMMRPDVAILPAMVKVARHLLLKLKKEDETFVLFSNVMHSQHLMAFCRSNMNEVWIRVKFFDLLLESKAPLVFRHFRALDLTSDLFLINWMLSLYASAIPDQEVMARILDCFFLEGEIYLFKVGICLILYRELELRTSTFEVAMRTLTHFGEISEAVLFKSID